MSVYFFVTKLTKQGKTTFITNLVIEHKYHFRQKIKKVVYFYKESCESIDRLKSHLSKEPGVEAVFSKKFPDGNFLDFCKPEQDATILVIDDFFFDATTDEKIRKDLISCSTIWTHHYGISSFLCLHSYDIFLKASKLNVILMNSSHLVFFKSSHDARAAKRHMNQYMLNLKGGQTLFDVYKRHVLEKNFNYVIAAISPMCTKPTLWGQILLAENLPMLGFHESSDEDE